MYLNEKRRSLKNRKMFLRVSICFPQHSPADHPYKHIRSTLTNPDRLFYHLKVSSTELEDDNLFELYLLSKYFQFTHEAWFLKKGLGRLIRDHGEENFKVLNFNVNTVIFL